MIPNHKARHTILTAAELLTTPVFDNAHRGRLENWYYWWVMLLPLF